MAAIVEEDEAFQQLVMQMEEAFKDHEHHKSGDDQLTLDHDIFARYLRARKSNFEAAKKMLEETLKWRQSFGIKSMHTKGWVKEIERETFTGKTYVNGFNAQGNCILYMRPRRENTFDHDSNLKHVVYNLERCIATMKKNKDASGPNQGKLILLIDFAGYSTLNAPPMKTSKETLSIIQNHYPERLHKAFIMRAPWIFSAFWTMVSPFIDPVTSRKIAFVKGTPEVMGKVLTDMSEGAANIDPAVLEADVGGSNQTLWDGQVYLGLSSAEPPVHKEGEKLPFEWETSNKLLPEFKPDTMSMVDKGMRDEDVIDAAKDAFGLTYQHVYEQQRAAEEGDSSTSKEATEVDSSA
jgi:hypothetical protein